MGGGGGANEPQSSHVFLNHKRGIVEGRGIIRGELLKGGGLQSPDPFPSESWLGLGGLCWHNFWHNWSKKTYFFKQALHNMPLLGAQSAKA